MSLKVKSSSVSRRHNSPKHFRIRGGPRKESLLIFQPYRMHLRTAPPPHHLPKSSCSADSHMSKALKTVPNLIVESHFANRMSCGTPPCCLLRLSKKFASMFICFLYVPTPFGAFHTWDVSLMALSWQAGAGSAHAMRGSKAKFKSLEIYYIYIMQYSTW